MQEKKIISSPLSYVKLLQETLEREKPLYRSRTYLSYRSILYRFLAWKLQNFHEPNVSYLDHLLKTGAAPQTAYNSLAIIRTFISKTAGLENDLTHIKRIKNSPRSPMVFSDEQLKLLRIYIQSLKPHFWLACALQYYCFIRPNELRYLRIADIDFVRHKIFLSHTFTKNKKDQFVSIPVPLRDLLKPLNNLDPRLYIFGYNRDFKPSKKLLTRGRLGMYFTQVLQTLGIEGRYSFYSLKHTGVERAVRAGVNIKEIQVQLRHHSLDMVNEYLKNLGVFELKDIDDKFPPLC